MYEVEYSLSCFIDCIKCGNNKKKSPIEIVTINIVSHNLGTIYITNCINQHNLKFRIINFKHNISLF